MQLSCIVIALFLGIFLPPQEDPPELIGRDMCLACHEIGSAYSSSAHGNAECESCHGPGSHHMDSGGDPELIRAADAPDWTDACLACHEQGEWGVTDFRHSPHGRNQVGCSDCHRAHPEKISFGLLKAESVSLCVDCHQSTEAAFRKPFHHPVLEGGMECIDCHSPHLEPRESFRRLEVVGEYGCATCHADKKGPFVFNHAPVAADECRTCHEPHGSFNSKMLVRSELHQLCLECHTLTPGVASPQPPAFHDIRSARYRNCTVCHREIHGSNVNPTLLR